MSGETVDLDNLTADDLVHLAAARRIADENKAAGVDDSWRKWNDDLAARSDPDTNAALDKLIARRRP
jgi:hypothetical protein